jgi:GNAT superfamily N-acetyltransferase
MEVVGFTIWKEKQVQPIHSSVKNPIHIIDLLLICSSNKSKGLGSIMMKDVELYGIRKHFEYIYLYPANEELVHFYNKNGYNIVAKFPDNLKMAKELFVKKSTRTTRRAQTHGAIPQRIRNNYDEYFANATPLGSQNINNL